MNRKHHYRLRLYLFTILLFVVSIVCFYMEFELHDDVQVEVPKVKIVTPVIQKEDRVMITINKESFLEDDDKYLLAKIAMAEAEGESIEGKALVMAVVLNRVKSATFPDTIKEVIYEERNGTYQFSPLSDGRFYKVEPNNDCWKALELIQRGECKQTDALYFTSSNEDSNWHSRNLEFLFQVGNHKFYK